MHSKSSKLRKIRIRVFYVVSLQRSGKIVGRRFSDSSAIMLRREVFPDPDGPRNAEISFDLHIPLTLLRMFLVEEFLFTFTYMSYYKFEEDISIFYFI